MGGGVPIPDVPVMCVVTPTESGDDTQRIQEAIDYVSALPLKDGFRGAVLLEAGEYRVDSPLQINNSGVVLRGEGQSEEGTIIVATGEFANEGVFETQYDSNGEQQYTKAVVYVSYDQTASRDSIENTKQIISDDYVSSGTNNVSVNDASVYSEGDDVIVKFVPTESWIEEIEMDNLWDGDDNESWNANSMKLSFERTIISINGNTLTLDIPLVQSIPKYHDGIEIAPGSYVEKYIKSKRIEKCGIEGIRFKSEYDESIREYVDNWLYYDEMHAHRAIQFINVENSWVRECTALYFQHSLANFGDVVRFCTVQDCAIKKYVSKIQGRRRYAFNLSTASSCILVTRCYVDGARHAFSTGSKAEGPNAFVDCYAKKCEGDTGPHHKYATGTLFDNVRARNLAVYNRSILGSGQGWAGAQTVFWNSEAYEKFIIASATGSMNFAIGCTSIEQPDDTSKAYIDYWNERVQPRSLFVQQLLDREDQADERAGVKS